MPRGDGTGPAGFGPMTGRGAGYCTGHNVPGYMNPYPAGRGAGRGRGPGRGFGWRQARGYYGRGAFPPYSPPVGTGYQGTPQSEREYLQDTAKALEEELNEVRKRLDELEEN